MGEGIVREIRRTMNVGHRYLPPAVVEDMWLNDQARFPLVDMTTKEVQGHVTALVDAGYQLGLVRPEETAQRARTRPLQHWEDQLVPVTPNTLVAKGDATTTTGDGGAYNAIFGAVAHIQLANQQNILASFPKTGYQRAGFRTRSARGDDNNVGVAEGASRSTSVEDTYQEIAPGLKEHWINTQLSYRLQIIEGKDDVVRFSEAQANLLENMFVGLNDDLAQDYDTLASNDIESIDRVTATDTATTNLSYTTDDENLYGVNRDANTWFNGYISENSNTDRILRLELVDALHQNVYDRWSKSGHRNKLYITGANLWYSWGYLEGSKHRITDKVVVASAVGGVQEMPGVAGGFTLGSYLGIPIVKDQEVADSGRRLYLYDLEYTHIVEGTTPQIVTSNDLASMLNLMGIASGRTSIYWAAELWAELPSACGQLRDITASS